MIYYINLKINFKNYFIIKNFKKKNKNMYDEQSNLNKFKLFILLIYTY